VPGPDPIAHDIDSAANAAFIVRSCNTHAELVAIAESVVRGEFGPAVKDQARAALTKAQGGVL
jgi:hypothetical protein